MTHNKKLSIIGLGKLGSTMAACFIHKGYEVIGVDINQDFVDAVNRGHSPIYEPCVDDLINVNKNLIQATTEIEFAIFHTDVSFIIVPTPSMGSGLFSTKYVESATIEIAKVLSKKEKYHVIVITSTILPGDTERIGKDIEKISGKKIGKDFGLVYNPDFIALGRIVHDFLNPDMILIGESDEKAGSIVQQIHETIVDNEPEIYRMNWYNAELAKVSLNSYCTLKLTFANIIAEICEKMPGGDAEIVLRAIGSDSRIGNKYFRGSLAWGGTCFPRDNRAFAKSVEQFGIRNTYSETTDRINDYHKTDRICNLLIEYLEMKNTNELAILGLAYKEDTPIVEEAVSLSVIKKLTEMGYKITVYDPAAMEEAKKELSQNDLITYAFSEYDCVKNKSVCFIATPWNSFKSLDIEQILKIMDNPIILDAWKILSVPENSKIDIRYIGKNINNK